MGNVLIRCSKCGKMLIRGKTLLNAIKYFQIENDDVVAGIMCTNCGHYVSEEKLREVIEKWRKGKK